MSVTAILLQTSADSALSASALTALLQPQFNQPVVAVDNAPANGRPGGAPSRHPPIVMDCDGRMVILMPLDIPAPHDIPAQSAHSRLWDKAIPTDIPYGAHTVVYVSGSDSRDHAQSIADARLLGKVIIAAMQLSDSIFAIDPGSAGHLVACRAFRMIHESPDPREIALVWAALNVGVRPDDGVLTGHTRGLDTLGLLDIEIPHTTKSGDEVLDLLLGLARYQVAEGPVIADSHTIGGEQGGEHIRVFHRPSLIDPTKTVLCLQLAPPSPHNAQPSWWKRRFS